MKDTTLAYLAGAIDSDGSIGIKRSTYAVRVTQDSKQPSYSERVMLRHVTPQVPALLKKSFGGALHLMRSSAGNGRPLWAWSVTDRKAAAALSALLPFLLVKGPQARNALHLRSLKSRSKAYRVRPGRGHVGSSPRSRRHGSAMEACYQKAKRLNRVGR